MPVPQFIGGGRITFGEKPVPAPASSQLLVQVKANALCGSERGVLVCVGHGEELTLEVSPDLIATERAVLGSEYFRFDGMLANLERLQAHREYLAPIITHRFPVGEIQAAFETFFGGQTGKVVIEQ